MSRSNGSAQTGLPAQQSWQGEFDAHGRPLDPNARWAQHPQGQAPQQPHAPQGYAPQQGYPDPQQQAYAQHPQAPHGYAPQPQHGYPEPAPGYHTDYPTAPPQTYGQAPADAYVQHGYPQAAPEHVRGTQAPQFERYQPQAGYDRYDTQLHIDPQHAAQQQYPGQHDPRAYGQQAYAQHGQLPQGDPRGWDLAQYSAQGHAAMPQAPAAQGYGQYPDPNFGQPAGQYQQGHEAWHQPQGAPHGQPGQPGQHGYDQGQFAAAGAQAGYDQAAAYDQADQAAELEDDEEPRRRGPSAVMVIGALVGAIALGGGLAYGYKKFGASPTAANASKTPVVKNDKAPVKEKPQVAGGKTQPHTDKVFANRLGEDKPGVETAAAPAPAAGDTEAPRKVTTVIVNRDGSITPTVPAAPATPPVGMGMVIDTGTPRPDLRGAQPPTTPVQRAQPRVAELPLPKVQRPEPKGDAPVAAVPAPVKKKPAVRDDLVSQQPGGAAPTVVAAPATPAAAKTVPGANGYVAVLTSRKSREDALKSFADLHQKYAAVLGNRPPDVREVNLGEKGVWYRLIVGPPGSRESAAGLCKQLKEQGFDGCFQMAY